MQTIKLSDSLQIRNLKKEYKLKKDKIASRLKEFDIFYNQPYSWFYNDGKIVLKETNKKNSD